MGFAARAIKPREPLNGIGWSDRKTEETIQFILKRVGLTETTKACDKQLTRELSIQDPVCLRANIVNRNARAGKELITDNKSMFKQIVRSE